MIDFESQPHGGRACACLESPSHGHAGSHHLEPWVGKSDHRELTQFCHELVPLEGNE